MIVAPTGVASAAESANATIGVLEAQGFDVKINRVGSAPLRLRGYQCAEPKGANGIVPVIGGGGDRDFVPVIVDRNITVTVDCSRR